jgi:hypothetical protein
MKLDKALAWFFWVWIALMAFKDVVVIVGFALVSRDFWQDLPSATAIVLNHYNPLYFPMFLASLVVAIPSHCGVYLAKGETEALAQWAEWTEHDAGGSRLAASLQKRQSGLDGGRTHGGSGFRRCLTVAPGIPGLRPCNFSDLIFGLCSGRALADLGGLGRLSDGSGPADGIDGGNEHGRPQALLPRAG